MKKWLVVILCCFSINAANAQKWEVLLPISGGFTAALGSKPMYDFSIDWQAFGVRFFPQPKYFVQMSFGGSLVQPNERFLEDNRFRVLPDFEDVYLDHDTSYQVGKAFLEVGLGMKLFEEEGRLILLHLSNVVREPLVREFSVAAFNQTGENYYDKGYLGKASVGGKLGVYHRPQIALEVGYPLQALYISGRGFLGYQFYRPYELSLDGVGVSGTDDHLTETWRPEGHFVLGFNLSFIYRFQFDE